VNRDFSQVAVVVDVVVDRYALALPTLNAVAWLAEIPGSAPDLARAVIAETGLDMTRFPTGVQLVSRAGLCPSARQSGPWSRAAKRGQGDTWLRGALGQAAVNAARTPPSSASATPGSPAAAARPRLRSPSPAPSCSSSGTCSLTRRPVHRTRPRLLRRLQQYGPQAPQSHPADSSARLHRHSHQDRITPYRSWPGPTSTPGPGPLLRPSPLHDSPARCRVYLSEAAVIGWAHFRALPAEHIGSATPAQGDQPSETFDDLPVASVSARMAGPYGAQ
jgi:hypothetical protein